MARSNTGNNVNRYSNATAAVTTTPCTLVCWFNVVDVTAGHALVSVSDTAAGNWFLLQAAGNLTGDPVIADALAGGSENFAQSSTSYTASAWHHGAAVFTSATSRTAYLNGGGAGNNTTSTAPSGLDRTEIGIVRDSTTAYAPINGSIAEAAIYNVALTAAEIGELAKGASPLLVRPDNLVAYWPLVGRTAIEQDIVGNFHLTVNGTMAQAAHVPRIIYPASQIWKPYQAAGGPSPVDGAVTTAQGGQTSAAVSVLTITGTATSGQGGQTSAVACAETFSCATTTAQGGQSSVAASAETITSSTATTAQGGQKSNVVSAETITSSGATTAQGSQSTAAAAAQTIAASSATTAQGSQSSVAAGAEAFQIAATTAQGSQSSVAAGSLAISGATATTAQGGQSSAASGPSVVDGAVATAQGGQSSTASEGETIFAAVTTAQGSQSSVAAATQTTFDGVVATGQGGQKTQATGALSIPATATSAQGGQSSAIAGAQTFAVTSAATAQGGQKTQATGVETFGATGATSQGGQSASALSGIAIGDDAQTAQGGQSTLASQAPLLLADAATSQGGQSSSGTADYTAPPEAEPITWRGGDDAPRKRGSKRRNLQDEYYEAQRQAKEFLREQIRLAFEGPQAEEIAEEIKPYVPKKYRKTEYVEPPRGLDIDRIMESRKMMARIEAAAQAAIDDDEEAAGLLLL